ncbi:unnamed protein product [Spirodela intermedia]|uniref:Uncharacterized protein n=1 Tax=Spirodela intermedia TaxID=51605 RepID=A0A7I8LG53_SPIIN|nr:unnamed protein product [Spirodela intermedia]
MIDAASGGTFMNKFDDEALDLIEMLAENSTHHIVLNQNGRQIRPRRGGMIETKAVESEIFLEKIDKQMQELRIEMEKMKMMLADGSIDFIIIYMKMTENINHAPIILGRPFLETVKAIIDWGKRIVELKFG